MDAQIATELDAAPTRRSARARAVSAIGPATAVVGIGWALVQPYRITLLDPAGRGFWELAVQPPLLVVLVGALFSMFVARGLVADLEDG
jgi:zona occludens toxin (predicted ATPase)